MGGDVQKWIAQYTFRVLFVPSLFSLEAHTTFPIPASFLVVWLQSMRMLRSVKRVGRMSDCFTAFLFSQYITIHLAKW